MRYTIHAACGCHPGKVRKNNEDNFYFAGKCLPAENSGLKHPVYYERPLNEPQCFSVFDGIGGENFGETAAFSAAKQMQDTERLLADFFISEKRYLEELVQKMNTAVVNASNALHTCQMGTTLVALYFNTRHVYVCNLGDSRAYRLRSGEFLQLSHDHVSSRPVKKGEKAALTQYLGIDPEEMEIEPYIAKGELLAGDQYLLCSDGLTDMLTNFEISDIMLKSEDAESCVNSLLQAALAHGGRDNITVIVCSIV